MKNEVFIGLTYGDPAGIGPEILLKTLNNWKFKFKPIVIGLKECLFKDKNKMCNEKPVPFYTTTKKSFNNPRYIPGKPSKNTGIHAYKNLQDAVSLARKNRIVALVTGPVSKEVVNSAHINFHGQTDAMAKICNVDPDSVIMLFVAGDFRIALFTRHIPLKSVSSKISKIKLKKYLLRLNKELKRWFHFRNPKIAILGLNPHAGEAGVFGNEEIKVITPVIKEVNSLGLRTFGPFSPDAILSSAGRDYLLGKKQKYDVYVSFYHDQSLPAFKAVAGFNGVNVSLGLPFLRVSPDHGTAFDIAGKNKASSESYISAVKLLDDLL